MNKSLLFSLALLWAAAVWGQPNTMSGFVAGVITQDNTYSVLGQPFVGQSAGYGYQVSEGIAQSQLVREEYSAEVNYSAGYEAHGFFYPMSTPPGLYHSYLYNVHGAQYHYDLLKILDLKVVPIPCGDDVLDVDLNLYPTVAVAGYCWTKKNLMVEHFPDGETVIPGAMVYSGGIYNNEGANLSTHGRLYTWYSAVNVPEGGSSLPIPDGNGFVRGICPDGWHIPTIVEFNALLSVPANALRSPETWLLPNSNVGGDHFAALASGLYNSDKNRFEGMQTETDFWSDLGNPSTSTGTALQLAYHCSDPGLVQYLATRALSVRCVRNY